MDVWTPLTIQYGVIVSHDWSVKYCVKTGHWCNGNALKHKSGYLGEDSIWTLVRVGPLPLVGCKNSELLPPDAGVWLYLEPHQTSTPPVAATVAAWLETTPTSTCGHRE